MSETRRVAVKLCNVDDVEIACKAADMQTVKKKIQGKERICLKNHGISTSDDIYFNELEDGTLELSGRCSTHELNKIAKKIQVHYAKHVAVKACTNMGYRVVSDVRDKTKKQIKVRVRAYA